MNNLRSSLTWGATLAVLVLAAFCESASCAASTETVLHNFGAGSDGYEPVTSLVFDAQGNLYGTTLYGGLNCLGGLGCGIAFQLRPNGDGSWSESVIHDFTGEDGERPNSPLVLDSRGNVYGTTETSANSGYGTIFELSPVGDGTWLESILHAFDGLSDGGYPHGVAFDKTGHLYGTTAFNSSGFASVISLARVAPLNWYEQVLHLFWGGRGGAGDPVGILTFDGTGAIYGTTYDGGARGSGTVFRLARNRNSTAWTETVLYAFKGTAFGSGSDGANPYDGLVFDAAGNLYGTTEWGGPAAMGTVFKLTPRTDGTWSESVIYAFKGGSDGGRPRSGLAVGKGGKLYGTTAGGAGVAEGPSYSYGTVFELTPQRGGPWIETVLYQFQGGLDGGTPVGGVILDGAGNLYGTTVYGGTYGEQGGVVFEVIP